MVFGSKKTTRTLRVIGDEKANLVEWKHRILGITGL